MFDEFLSKADPTHAPATSERREKAKAAGSLGGPKGGTQRAKNLTAKKRKATATGAAIARWKRKP